MSPPNPPKRPSSTTLPAVEFVAPGAVHDFRAPQSTDTISTVPPPAPDHRAPPKEYAGPRTMVRAPGPRPPPLPFAGPEEHTLIGLSPALAAPAHQEPQDDDGDRPSTVQALKSAETLTDLVSEKNARIAELERQAAEKPAARPIVEPADLPTAHVVLAGNKWRIGVPIAMLSPLLLWLWTQVQAYLDLGRQLKALNATVVSYESRMAADEKLLADTRGEIGTLRETQAKLSGYLAGALPMAGVSVPGAEVGAINVAIDREPDRVGLIRRTPVVTHTRVPAPPPLP